MNLSNFLQTLVEKFKMKDISSIKKLFNGYFSSFENQFLCKTSEDKKSLLFFSVTEYPISQEKISELQNSTFLSLKSHNYCEAETKDFIPEIDTNSIPSKLFVLILEIDAIPAQDENYSFLSNYIMNFISGSYKKSELDGLLKLMQIGYDDVLLIKASLAYLNQIGHKYSYDQFISSLKSEKSKQILSEALVYFKKKFKPTGFNDQKNETASDRIKEISKDHDKFLQILDKFGFKKISKKSFALIENDEKIVLKILTLFRYTSRTTFFRNQFSNKIDDRFFKCFSFKFNTGSAWQMMAEKNEHIDDLLFEPLKSILPEMLDNAFSEIFVFSDFMEGVHIRHNFVSRGGIRYSSRQDYRMEALDLANTQNLKNVVVVPDGAKGCFISKNETNSQDDILKSYQTFISEFIGITDNINNKGESLHPMGIVCYEIPFDEKIHDEYIVAAADKGTSGFIDHANRVSLENGYWIADAFASGGKNGYNHKELGITSLGLMESLYERLFQLGISHNSDLKICGIGSMAGDVFGNALMLIEKPILLAAFDSSYVIVNPNPNPSEDKKIFKNMFEKCLGWSEYDRSKLSKGGILAKLDEEICITKECCDSLSIDSSKIGQKIKGRELIPYILKAKVDIILNGGIGTFIKTKSENSAAARDASNDDVRINIEDVRAKIIGEGGNLGMTFESRIVAGELFEKNNQSLVFSDSVDNCGGVKCSDYEVNIKMLLNQFVINNKINLEERQSCLNLAKNEVSKLVCLASFQQCSRIISYLNNEYIERYESKMMNRPLNLIFDNSAINSINKSIDNGIRSFQMNPSKISYIILISKFVLKNYLNKISFDQKYKHYQTIFNRDFMYKILQLYFPKSISSKFKEGILDCKFSPQIFISYLTNQIVDILGFDFIFSIDENSLILNMEQSILNYIDLFVKFDIGSKSKNFFINKQFVDFESRKLYNKTLENLSQYNASTLTKGLCVKAKKLKDLDLSKLVLI